MSKRRPVRSTGTDTSVSKWDPVARIVDKIQAEFAEHDSLFQHYGFGESYSNLPGLLAALQERPGKFPAAYLLLTFRDWAAMAYWNQYKEVYTMHPALTRELRATAIDDKIPGSVLRQLPHHNPMFVFPEGIPVEFKPAKDGTEAERGKILAIVITGATNASPGRANYTSTADSAANGLYLSVIAEVHDKDGTVVDTDTCHTSIPFTDGDFTIADVIDETQVHHSFDETGISNGFTDEAMVRYVRHVVGIGLAHLLYTVASNADIAAPRRLKPRQTTASGSKTRAPRPLKHQLVGYTIGAALDAARRERAQRGPATGTTGRHVEPHLRKAHFHTIAFGPGRSQRRVEWFPPIPVKMDGPAKKPTIHGY